MGFYRLVGVAWGGFEGQLLAILIAIEAEEIQKQKGLASTPKKRNEVGSCEGWSVQLIMIEKRSALVIVREGKGVINFFYEA